MEKYTNILNIIKKSVKQEVKSLVTVIRPVQISTRRQEGGSEDVPLNTDDLPEGTTNQYYTEDRVATLLQEGVGIDLVYNTTSHSLIINSNINLIELPDVTVTSPANNDVIKYSTATSKWINGPLTAALDDLTDVIITTPSNLQVLQYSTATSNWINATITIPTTLAALTGDVSISSPTHLQILQYSTATTKWENASIVLNKLSMNSTMTSQYLADLIDNVTIVPSSTANVTVKVADNLNIKNVFNTVYDAGTSGAATKTIDWNNGTEQQLSLNGNSVIAFSNVVAGMKSILYLVQDGTGNRTVTWPAAVKWGTTNSGIAPVLSTVASKMDIVTLIAFTTAVIAANLFDKGFAST